MKKQDLNIIYEFQAGSHAYNLNIPTSDVDIRGIFIQPKRSYISVKDPIEQWSENKHDTVYYDLRRFFRLASGVNPNISEFFWIDKANIIKISTIMDKVIKNRDLFMSKKAYHSFSGYAYSQISKARGQNKRIVNPQQAEKPDYLDFCRLIEFDDYHDFYMFMKREGKTPKNMPGRPIPLKETGMDLTRCHAAKLEYVNWGYRIYHYGENAKGVFRGTENDGYAIVTESIKIEDEWPKFIGILLFNEDEFKHANVQHKQYLEWMATRNEARWVDQKNKATNFDSKNIMHCFRLLMSCKNILVNGCPIVRFSDDSEDRKFLMGIRKNEFKYEYLMDKAKDIMDELKELYEKSTLQYEVDQDKIEDLYMEIMDEIK